MHLPHGRSLARAACSALLLASALRLEAVGGTLQDQAVSLVLPSTHWSALPDADFKGTEPAAATDIVYQTGWWYRIDGLDSREYPLPPPTSESYGGSGASFNWVNLRGLGLDVIEHLQVLDREGPSGSFTSTLAARAAGPLTVSFFHYLDMDMAGTGGGDSAVRLAPAHVGVADGASLGRYRGDGGHFLCRPLEAADSVRQRLNDAAADNFDDSGLPASGDVACGLQWTTSLTSPGGGYLHVGRTVFSANLPAAHVKGDLMLNGGPDLVFQDPLGNVIAWNLRRTIQYEVLGTGAAGRIVGIDDFDGDFVNDILSQDPVTRTVYINGAPLQAPVLASNWKVAASADLNQDLKADIVWRNTTSNKLVVWLMSGTLRLGAVQPIPDQAADANWELVAAADMNGDFHRDFVWYNQTTGRIVLWTMSANLQRIAGYFTTPSSVGSNAWKVVAVGDYGKGDGSERPAVANTNDLVWQNDVSGRVVVWHLNHAGERTSGVFTTPDSQGPQWQVVGPR